MLRAIVLLLMSGVSAVAADVLPSETDIPDALHRFVARPEPDFSWSMEESRQVDTGKVYSIELVSQRWQDIVWEHALTVFEPAKIIHPRHMLLFVTGGRNGNRASQDELAFGVKLAELCGARIAMLHQVPNQPLLGDRVEDDLITETWLKYLETGDETWPLLFPMVKSAIKAMDALQQLAVAQQWERPEGFVISGASKRGWTSWLTPAADRRLVATAPIVIDVLNFQRQMKHQLDTWGKFSEQIDDYTRKGLVRGPNDSETPREARLRRLMDPYTYRNLLGLPKLMIIGTNDRYWTVDAMGLYWDDLIGPKHVLAVPNAGHNLKGGRDGAFLTLAVFFRHAALGTALPNIDWKFSPDKAQWRLSLRSDQRPAEVRIWSTSSESKDFRGSQWSSQIVPTGGDDFTASVGKPANGHVALFGELQYEWSGLRYSLSTLVFAD